MSDQPNLPTGATQPYIGRFAPSPTGPLHVGSLLAALGSYLQARAARGKWLMRIEDLDPPRTVPGAADAILRCLEQLGLEWDGPVLWQSERTDAYQAALATLTDRGLAYRCTCSRKDILAAATRKGPSGTPVYPGTCRSGTKAARRDAAIRVHTEGAVIEFVDALQGRMRASLDDVCGDFVLRRRDGHFSYQLAVTVDDEYQGVTEIVRGIDLLDSTPRQIHLGALLGYGPRYFVHLPIIVTAQGEKLSKQTGAEAVDATRPGPLLHNLLRVMAQQPPPELAQWQPRQILRWAVENWSLKSLKLKSKVPLAALR